MPLYKHYIDNFNAEMYWSVVLKREGKNTTTAGSAESLKSTETPGSLYRAYIFITAGDLTDYQKYTNVNLSDE